MQIHGTAPEQVSEQFWIKPLGLAYHTEAYFSIARSPLEIHRPIHQDCRNHFKWLNTFGFNFQGWSKCAALKCRVFRQIRLECQTSDSDFDISETFSISLPATSQLHTHQVYYLHSLGRKKAEEFSRNQTRVDQRTERRRMQVTPGQLVSICMLTFPSLSSSVISALQRFTVSVSLGSNSSLISILCR